jgi:hypothetical protein
MLSQQDARWYVLHAMMVLYTSLLDDQYWAQQL